MTDPAACRRRRAPSPISPSGATATLANPVAIPADDHGRAAADPGRLAAAARRRDPAVRRRRAARPRQRIPAPDGRLRAVRPARRLERLERGPGRRAHRGRAVAAASWSAGPRSRRSTTARPAVAGRTTRPARRRGSAARSASSPRGREARCSPTRTRAPRGSPSPRSTAPAPRPGHRGTSAFPPQASRRTTLSQLIASIRRQAPRYAVTTPPLTAIGATDPAASLTLTGVLADGTAITERFVGAPRAGGPRRRRAPARRGRHAPRRARGSLRVVTNPGAFLGQPAYLVSGVSVPLSVRVPLSVPDRQDQRER